MSFIKGATAFARTYNQVTGGNVSRATIDNIRKGEMRPSYQFISDLADHALLSLDPVRLQPATPTVHADDQRVALFSAAGLIEVTPDSIAQWNDEILAGLQRKLLARPARAVQLWQEVMRKLVEFHCQGGRMSHEDIAESANAVIGPDGTLNTIRVDSLLTGGGIPSEAERTGLAAAVGLTASQSRFIEEAVGNGNLALGQKRRMSEFSTRLVDLLERLRAHDITQNQLVLLSVPDGRTEPQLSRTAISTWKHGLGQPTMATLRGLVYALDRCAQVVTPEEVTELLTTTGFTRHDLNATSHDVIARLDESSRLKPLLAALRNAADINLSVRTVTGLPGMSGIGSNPSALKVGLENWENEGSVRRPTQAELTTLLTAYNSFLREQGEREWSPDQIEAILDVARRDRDAGLQRGLLKQAREHRPSTPRRRIRPDFDEGPGM